MNGTRLMIFDTATLYFRAFHGLPTTLRSSEGTPVNAIRGLLDSIARLVDQYRPTHLVCAWDNDWRPGWRVRLIPSYKAHRVAADGLAEQIPDDLKVQLQLITEILAMLAIPVAGVANYEADDVLASCAASFEGDVLAVSGDKDIFQVVTDRVQVVYIGRGVAGHELVDGQWLRDRYGVSADRLVDFMVLRGDASDGLPGVRGIGERTAASLISAFGGLEQIVAAAKDDSGLMTRRIRERITEAEQYLISAERVARAVSDLELPRIPRIDPGRIDDEGFRAAAARLNLGGSAERVLRALRS